MNLRVTAVWTVAIAASVGLGAVALHRPAPYAPPALGSGPLFALRPGITPISLHNVVPVTVTLDDKGCITSPVTVPPGPVTFTVVNPGHTAVNEAELTLPDGSRILAEAEGVDPGSTFAFSYKLDEGTYLLNCPGTGAPATRLTVAPARG